MTAIESSIQHGKRAFGRQRLNKWVSRLMAAKRLGISLADFNLLWADGAVRAQVRHHFEDSNQGHRQLVLYWPELEAMWARLMANEVAV